MATNGKKIQRKSDRGRHILHQHKQRQRQHTPLESSPYRRDIDGSKAMHIVLLTTTMATTTLWPINRVGSYEWEGKKSSALILYCLRVPSYRELPYLTELSANAEADAVVLSSSTVNVKVHSIILYCLMTNLQMMMMFHKNYHH